MRKLVVDGQEWQVKIGKDDMEAWTPDHLHKLVIPLTVVTGRTPDTIERGRHKKTSDGMVTPKMMVEAIRDTLAHGHSGWVGGNRFYVK